MFNKACLLLLVVACSCSSENEHKKTNEKQAPNEASSFVDTILQNRTIPEQWKGKALAGIDFIATGNEPFWSFELDEESAMHFQTPDGLEMIAPAVVAETTENGSKLYRADTDAGSLQVEVENKLCINRMSGDSASYSVVVTLKQPEAPEKIFKGCGTSLKY